MSSLKGGAGQALEAASGGRPVDQAEGPGDAGDREHADEDGAADFLDFERDHEDQAEERERGGGIADVAEADEGVRDRAPRGPALRKPMKAMNRPMPLATAA